jgi:hypothetical protein
MSEGDTTEFLTSNHWQLFSPDEIDLSTIEKEYTEYRDINVNVATTQNRYEIEARDKDAFILPHDGYLEVRYHVTNADGTALAATENTTFQNNALSLFKNIEYLIEDQRIEYLDQPGLARTMKDLSEWSNQYGNSIASMQQFYFDKHDGSLARVRFFNNTAPRQGNEIFLVQSTTNNGSIACSILDNAGGAPFVSGDTVVAYVGGYLTGIPCQFVYATLANWGVSYTETTCTLTSSTNSGCLTPAAGAANNIFGILFRGELLTWYTTGGVASSLSLITNANPNANTRNVVITPTNNASGTQVYAEIPRHLLVGNGFERRLAPARGTAAAIAPQVTAYIPFKNMFLFCRAYDKVSRGLRHKIVLNKEDPGQVLYRDPGTTSTDRGFNIDYISFWVPRLKPNLETLKAIEAKLRSDEMFDVNFTDLTLVRPSTTQTGNASNNAFQLASTTKKPIRVWVGFQKYERIQSSQTINKRVFDSLGTTAIQVRLNGKIFPMYEYKFDTTNLNQGWARAFMMFMNAGYKTRHYDDGSLLTMQQYMDTYPIFYFDLTYQDEDLYKAVKQAELEVRWSNQAGTFALNGYNLWIVYESERLIRFKGVSGSLALVL